MTLTTNETERMRSLEAPRGIRNDSQKRLVQIVALRKGLLGIEVTLLLAG